MGHFGCVFGCVYVREVMIACPHAAHGSGQVLGPLSCQWRSVEACRERVVRLKSFTFPHFRPSYPSVFGSVSAEVGSQKSEVRMCEAALF